VTIAALEQALNDGEEGLDLVIQALQDKSVEIQNSAYSLLQSRKEKIHKALIIFDAAQLKSAIGMDYKTLRDLLAQGKWKEANKETEQLMIAVAEREYEGWLRVEDIENFPCEDFCTIDHLWVKYSNGRFGFSVQKRIFQNLGGMKEFNDKIWNAFGDKVGWRISYLEKDSPSEWRRNFFSNEKPDLTILEQDLLYEQGKLLFYDGMLFAVRINGNWVIVKESWGYEEGDWLEYDGITFDIKAPEGHLPITSGERGVWKEWEDPDWDNELHLEGFGETLMVLNGWMDCLFSRVESCKL
jgi:hypothetical protein